MNYAVDLPHAKIFMLSLKMKRMAFKKHILYSYGNLCTATQSTVREIYDFFHAKIYTN